MRVVSLVAALAVGCVSLAIAVPAASSASEASSAEAPCGASTHYVDAAHDGLACAPPSSTLARKWSVKLNGFASYPVMGAGMVFVTTAIPGSAPFGGWLYALHASDGSVAWGPVRVMEPGWNLPLAYDDGRVFVDTADGTALAFDASTGKKLWSRRTFNAVMDEPVARDGVVYVQSSDDVFALSEVTGKVVWSSPELNGVGGEIAVDDTGVYVSSACARFRLSFATGAIIWSQNDGCSGGGGGVSFLSGGRFYEQANSAILQEQSGAVLGSFAGIPAFSNGNGYFVFGSGLFAEDVATLTPLFTKMLPKPIKEGPVIGNGLVYVAGADKILYALSTSDGHVVQTLALPDAPHVDVFDRLAPQDLNIGGGLLIAPTGRIVSAFG